MTYIQDIPDGPNRERIRAEILRNLDKRKEDAHNALTEYIKYMGIVLSGGTIAILGFIAARKGSTLPVFAIVSLLCFVLAILTFSVLLYLHYDLLNARWALYAETADNFFTRKASLEDVHRVPRVLQSAGLFSSLFWVPFAFMAFGFLCAVGGAFTLI
jgi:hypothetical protein